MSFKILNNKYAIAACSSFAATTVATSSWIYGESTKLPSEHQGCFGNRVSEVVRATFKKGDINRSVWDHVKVVASLSASTSNTPKFKLLTLQEKIPFRFTSVESVVNTVPKATSSALPIFAERTESRGYFSEKHNDELVIVRNSVFSGYTDGILYSDVRKALVDGDYMKCLSSKGTSYLLIGTDCQAFNKKNSTIEFHKHRVTARRRY